MDVAELTRRMHDFVGSKGWYDADSRRPQTPPNLAKSLVIEAGEVLELFQWNDKADTEALEGELADVFLYLLQLADVSGIDLEAATLRKLAVNQDRTWERPSDN
ncbi:MazG nucleotide pyrophosphohydrolase domain protein [compost metagenome]